MAPSPPLYCQYIPGISGGLDETYSAQSQRNRYPQPQPSQFPHIPKHHGRAISFPNPGINQSTLGELNQACESEIWHTDSVYGRGGTSSSKTTSALWIGNPGQQVPGHLRTRRRSSGFLRLSKGSVERACHIDTELEISDSSYPQTRRTISRTPHADTGFMAP
jgi:hypothetical protein